MPTSPKHHCKEIETVMEFSDTEPQLILTLHNVDQ